MLVFTEWPMVAWHMEMFVTVLSFWTLSLQSQHSDEDKTIIVSRFNNLKVKINVLIIMYQTCAVGINLHRACPNLVMIEPAINANTALQAIRRVH